MKTKSKPFVVSLLVAIAMLSGAAAVVIFPPIDTTLTIDESISISAESTTLTLHPNECGYANYTVTNSGSENVSVTFSIAITSTPPNGSASDVSLTPSDGTFNAVPGTSTLSITACADNGIVPGDYTIHGTFERD